MWVLPSYGRPSDCAAVIAAMKAHGSTAPGIVYVCEDDPKVSEYLAMSMPEGWSMVTMVAGYGWQPDKLQHAFAANPDAEWYGWTADDIYPQTDGFEQALIGNAGAWGIASGNDLWQAKADIRKGRMHGATVFGGEFLRAWGQWVPPGFKHWYIEDVWETLGRELGNWRILMDVVTEHRHPFKDGAAGDETRARANEDEIRQAGEIAYREWVSNHSVRDIHFIRMAMWETHGLSLEDAKQRKVLFGLPVYDKVSPQREAALLDTVCVLSQLGITCGHAYAVGQPIHIARNNIADAFIRSQFTDLLFIDGDMSFSPWDVVKMLAAPHPLLAGVGRKRTETADDQNEAWCFGVEQENLSIDRHGMVEVAQVGTGFMRIRKEVFRDIAENMPGLLRYRDSDKTKEYLNFFEWTQYDDQDIGEDFTFCRRYTEVGGKVFIDPSITLSHFGPKEWRASVMSVLSYV